MKRALVLAGGGSKGAYHIGVLMAIKECEMEFDIITGTSIGALIGCMTVQGRADDAIKLWKTLQVTDVIEGGVEVNIHLKELFERKAELVQFAKNSLKEKRVNIDPLIQMIWREADYDQFMASKIDFGLVTYNVTKNQAVYVTKKDLTRDNLPHYLLASASCFPVFPLCNFNGENFVDGGYADNCPVELAMQMGAEEYVIVDLDPKDTHPEFYGRPDMIRIAPYQEIGSWLDFSRECLDERICLGYLDGMKAFGKLEGVQLTFLPDSIGPGLIERFYHCLLGWEMELNRGTFKKGLTLFSSQPCTSYLTEYQKKTLQTKKEYSIAALDCLGELFFGRSTDIHQGSEIVSSCTQYYNNHISELETMIHEVISAKISVLAKLVSKFNSKDLVCIFCWLLQARSYKNTLLVLMTLFSKEFSVALFLFCGLEENE